MKADEFDELLEKISCGDEQAFGILCDTYGRMIRTTAFSFVKNNCSAEEIVDDILVKIWNEAKNLKIQYPSSWIYQTTKNHSLNYLRKKEEIPVEGLEQMVMDENNLIRKVESELNFQQLIETLTNDEQQLIQLRFLYDYKLKDIAKELNMNIFTIESRIKSCLKKIKKFEETSQKSF